MDHNRSDQWDVIVVGAGPTGLTTASLLAQYGVRVLLVERNEHTVEQPRAVSLDDESLRTLQAAGVADVVMQDLAMDVGSVFLGPGGKLLYRVEPTTREYGFPRRSAVVQPVLEATLRRCLETRTHAETLFGWSCEKIAQNSAGVHLTLRNQAGEERHVQAQYMVAADGGRSPTRDVIGSHLQGETYSQRWLIVDLEGTADRFRQSVALADPARPHVNLPGSDGRRRFEFMIHPHESEDAVTQEAFVRNLLAKFGPDKDATIARRQVYTFHARVCDKWREGRIFLAGDAAHLSPPFAGQGMNSGIRDAHNIAWKLATVLNGDLGDALLDTYQSERAPHAQALVNMAVRNGRIIMSGSGWYGGMQRAYYYLANRIPAVANYFKHMKNKPKASYVDGFVAADGEPKTMAGRLFFQPRLERTDRSVVLADDLIGPGFGLVVFGRDAQDACQYLLREDWGIASIRGLAITPWNYNLRRDRPDVVSGRDLDHLMGDADGDAIRVWLVRPDRYVAFDAAFHDNGAQIARRFRALVATTGRPGST